MICSSTIKAEGGALPAIEAEPRDLLTAIVLIDLNLETLQRFPATEVTHAMQESLLKILAQLETALAGHNQKIP